MTFKKLVLVSAMFAATSGAYAMEAMDEEALAAATGQDGITIGLATQMEVDLIVHDKDGFTGVDSAGVSFDYSNSGAIVLDNFALYGSNAVQDGTGAWTTKTNATVGITIDAGAVDATTTTDRALNIGIKLGNGANIGVKADLGELKVANSNRTTTSTSGMDYGVVTNSTSATLLDLGTVTIADGASINIQLGAEPQGYLIFVNSSLTGGLTLSNVALNDVGGAADFTGGSIGVDNLFVKDVGGTALTAKIGVDADDLGLKITLQQVGDATNGLSVIAEGVNLGSATSIGDVEIVGLNMNGDVITVRGH